MENFLKKKNQFKKYSHKPTNSQKRVTEEQKQRRQTNKMVEAKSTALIIMLNVNGQRSN